MITTMLKPTKNPRRKNDLMEIFPVLTVVVLGCLGGNLLLLFI